MLISKNHYCAVFCYYVHERVERDQSHTDRQLHAQS